jgi:cytochrome d ubiquinol oxidase subunit II
MILLIALIFRAVAIEFRGKVETPAWKRTWDWAFGIGSFLPAFLLGIAYGNILQGIPIERGAVYTGGFLGLLGPFPLLVGILGITTFTLHGAIYLTMKTEGSLRQKLVRWASRLWLLMIALYVLATNATFFAAPFLLERLGGNLLFWALLLIFLASSAAIPSFLTGARYGRAFVASSAAIASVMGISAVGLFPRLVPSSIDLSYSLTAYNASSSPATLSTMLVIAAIGMPLVLGYTIFIHRVFKGKVVITPDSY